MQDSLYKESVKRRVTLITCGLIILIYVMMIDLKGISSDEGMRLGIMNGGDAYSLATPQISASWEDVVEANKNGAYQPLYFLIQNTLMRVAQTHDVVFLRLLNIVSLALILLGLLQLSKKWELLPTLFLITVFSLNAYLFMHIFQIREYSLGITIYVWTTILVFKLEHLRFRRPLLECSWFIIYATLLIIGFYLQLWVIFPAIAQGLFLLIRRRTERIRFYAHLALSYLLVISATLPYLLSHSQKVDVGMWGSTTSELWPQLATGFHLILSGHLIHQHRFSDFLPWLYLSLISLAVAFYCLKGKLRTPEGTRKDFAHQGAYMSLCILVSLTFQIGYFYFKEDLSLWPRYFAIHYFFLTWLVALSFKYICDTTRSIKSSLWARHGATAFTGLIMTTAVASGVFQIQSYYHNPFLDTGVSRHSNWQIWASSFAQVVLPGDLVVSHDYIRRATITFSHPINNPVILLHELEHIDNLEIYQRIAYLESTHAQSEREGIQNLMSNLGFTEMHEVAMHTADGQTLVSGWRGLVFTRD